MPFIGHFLRPPFGEILMIPIPKAVIDIAVALVAAITSEVLAKRSAIQRDASNGKEDRNDRPS